MAAFIQTLQWVDAAVEGRKNRAKSDGIFA